MKKFKRHISKRTSYSSLIAALLLLISSLFVLPKEIVHEFCNHTDTEDFAYSNTAEDGNGITSHSDHAGVPAGDAIGSLHQHCEVLQLFYQPYSSFVPEFNFQSIVQDFILSSVYHSHFSSGIFALLDIRGPPTAI